LNHDSFLDAKVIDLQGDFFCLQFLKLMLQLNMAFLINIHDPVTVLLATLCEIDEDRSALKEFEDRLNQYQFPVSHESLLKELEKKKWDVEFNESLQ
jgi:hypothetical protein